MCKINCSGGCFDCAPEENFKEALEFIYDSEVLAEFEKSINISVDKWAWETFVNLFKKVTI